MRKHLIKKLLIFGITALQASCSEDLYEEHTRKSNLQIKVTEKSFEELSYDKKFMSAYSKISIQNNAASKMIMEQNYNFTISDTPAKVIEIGGKTSYTFHITRDTINSDYFENLIVDTDSLNQIKAYIAKYKKDYSKPALINNIPFTKFTYNSIVYNNTIAKQTVIDCITKVYSLCNGVGGDCGGSICGFGSITVCEGSGGGNTEGSDGTTWNGGGTTTTIPIENGGSGSSTPPTPDPCETLTQSKSDSKVQTSINFLKTKTTGKQEFAYEIERKKTDYTETGSTYNTILKTGNNFGVIVGYGVYVQGQAHNHPINGLHIPSWDDIYWTQGCEEENTNFNNGSAYNIIVAPDPTNPGETILWAITIDNIVTLQQATNAVFDLPEIAAILDEELKRDEIKKIFGDKFVAIQFDTDAQEKMFLQTYANYGITLSKFNETTDKWEKLKLDPTNPNIVTKVPCN